MIEVIYIGVFINKTLSGIILFTIDRMKFNFFISLLPLR